jgi:hypothetical protein
MTSRERTLAILLVAGILLGGGALLGYMFVYSPLQAKWADKDRLDAEITELDSKLRGLNQLKPRIAEAKRQSLPPDADRAKLQYQQMLEHLRPTQLASPNDFKVSFSKEQPITGTPELAPKKPAYKRLEFMVKLDNANVWQVVDFLTRYYQIDLLHQVTELKITRMNKPSEARNQLDVVIMCEALILDGVEPRSTLFPVSGAVAAVGGIPAVEAVVGKPELARRLTPVPSTPVLASRTRDYSFIVKHDMFYGLLPKPDTEPPFKVDRLADVTISKPEEAPPPVRVRVSGKGSAGATVAAEVKDGTLLPLGPLTVDPKTLTITLPKVTEELGSDADALVSVIVTSAEGEKKTSLFTVAMGKAPRVETPKLGPDISSAIKLLWLNTSSEGDVTTVTAMIWDAANPLKYEIVASAKGVQVKKWVQEAVPKSRPPRKEWVLAKDYAKANSPDVLAFSDDFSSTKRTFKIVLVEDEAVIVAETSGSEAPKAEPKQPGKFGFGGGGRPARQGPADPLAVVAGNLAAAVPRPVYYRWPLGKSLQEVLDPKNECRLSAEEVKKILKRLAESGPLASVLTSDGN